MQNRSAHQFVQVPQLSDPELCPVRAIRGLMDSRPLPQTAPLFVHDAPNF